MLQANSPFSMARSMLCELIIINETYESKVYDEFIIL